MAASVGLRLMGCSGPGSKCIDGTLALISLSTTIFGVVNVGLSNTITGIGYISTGVFAGVSFVSIRSMRLRDAVQKSVNVLKEENDELKENNDILQENNEDLKENVDKLGEKINELKGVENELKLDLDKLAKLLGLVGEKSEDAIKEVKDILSQLNTENDRHSLLVKKQILLYIYNENNENTHLAFKDILLQLFPDLEWKVITDRLSNKKLN